MAPFMLPKGLIRHPEEADCPYIALSKHTKGDHHDQSRYFNAIEGTAPKAIQSQAFR
jgi:hypothetical protein